MFVKQISVYVENKPGKLKMFTDAAAGCDVDMKAISIADTTDFGILRCIVDKPDLAVEHLNKNGFAASITDVIAIGMTDEPGSLAKVSDILTEEGIVIQYIYSFVKPIDNCAVIIFKVDEAEKAVIKLKEKGVPVFNMEQVVNS